MANLFGKEENKKAFKEILNDKEFLEALGLRGDFDEEDHSRLYQNPYLTHMSSHDLEPRQTATNQPDELFERLYGDERNSAISYFKFLNDKTVDEDEGDVEDKVEEKKEMVDHPDHYNQGLLETMEKFLLYFHGNPDMIKGALLFNVLKYTDRAGHKGNKEEDEKKALFYLDVFETLFDEEFELLGRYRVYKNSK